ncbi:MAG: HDOD domain-containing protein [Magnetococcales bacterium]|nr:HDOD domain-containing protein [Magnetococcales bacterium]
MGNKLEKKQLKIAREITRKINLPSRPKVILEISRLSEIQGPNWRTLSYQIKRDMALAAAILKEANTTLTKKHRGQIASIEKAIIHLGWQRIKKILEKNFLRRALVSHGSLTQEIRQEGVATAETAIWLAQRIAHLSPHFQAGDYPLPAQDQTYASALFLDCGMIAMDQAFSDYGSFLDQVRRDRDQNQIGAENDTYGTNHALAGHLMAKDWKLPKPVTTIILDHHQAAQFNRPGQKVKYLRYTIMHGIILIAGHLRGEISLPEWETMEDRILDFFAITHKEIEMLASDRFTEDFQLSR